MGFGCRATLPSSICNVLSDNASWNAALAEGRGERMGREDRR